MKIVHAGNELCDVSVADTFFTRLRGLMFKKHLDASSGLLIQKCSSIHTCFMRFPIDVIYLDKDYTVLYSETVIPWRIGKIVKHTKHVLELPTGRKEWFQIGYKLDLIDSRRKDYGHQ